MAKKRLGFHGYVSGRPVRWQAVPTDDPSVAKVIGMVDIEGTALESDRQVVKAFLSDATNPEVYMRYLRDEISRDLTMLVRKLRL